MLRRQNDFWGPVVPCRNVLGIDEVRIHFIDTTSQTKITNPKLTIAINKEIAFLIRKSPFSVFYLSMTKRGYNTWLQVTMENIRRMHPFESAEDLVDKVLIVLSCQDLS